MKCEICDDCVYIGEGDSICTKDEPKIIITDFCIKTDEYGWCKKR